MAGCADRVFSTSAQYTFSPPVMIMSFFRSTTNRKPSSSARTRSPEWNQPPRNASAVAAGFCQYPAMTDGPR